MSPFKRPGSPYWQIWPSVHGYGRVGPFTTGTKDKARASQMEAMLKELPLRGHGELLRMLPKGFTLRELYAANISGTLEQLKEDAKNRPLAVVIDEVDRFNEDYRIKMGLNHLRRLVPAGVRCNWLLDPKNLNRLLRERQAEGAKRNTVRRGMMRAISYLVDEEFGSKERRDLFAEVRFPKENDERTIMLSPEQIRDLLDAAVDPVFEEFVRIALGTGLDVSPILRIQPEHFDGEELEVYDNKTSARRRRIQVGAPAASALRRVIAMKGARHGELVFGWSYQQVIRRWRITRAAVDLKSLRVKDLRGIFATYYLLGGGHIRDLQHIMGHTNPTTTLKYVRRLPLKRAKAMDDAAFRMGLVALRVEKTGT